MTAMRSKADIKLELLKRAANDPRRTSNCHILSRFASTLILATEHPATRAG